MALVVSAVWVLLFLGLAACARVQPARAGSARAARASAAMASRVAESAPALLEPPRELAPLGFSFSVGGLLFPYQLGVGVSLTESGHIVPGVTPLSGSSAGSLVATVLALGLDLELVMARLEAILVDCRRGGTAGRLGGILERELLTALPDDASERLSNGCLTVAYMRLLPFPRAVRCADFRDREDLFDVLRASCNWPFFLARSPLVLCRNSLSLDGYFVAPRSAARARARPARSRSRARPPGSTEGCPVSPLRAIPSLAVYPPPPFPASRTLGCLMPMQNAQRTVAVSAFPAFAVPTLRADVPEHNLIHPNMDGRFPGLPEGLPDWLQSAMQAYSPARTSELYEMGRAHGRLWVEQHSGAAPLRAAPSPERPTAGAA